MDKILPSVISISIAAVLIVLTLTVSQCTQKLQEASNVLASSCITSGGMWITTGSANAATNGMCVRGTAQK